MLADQNLVAHELYRMAQAPAVLIVTQANGDAVVRGLAPQLNQLAADYGAKGVEVLMLNPTGHAIVSLCTGNSTFAEIVTKLAERYKISPEEISPQVTEYLNRLRERNLLELQS